jgi:hypothetical protein
MIRKLIGILLAAILLGGVAYFGLKREKRLEHYQNDEITILLLHSGEDSAEARGSLSAFESVIKEEGISSKRIVPELLIHLDTKQSVHSYPLIILPDYAASYLSPNVAQWLKRYTDNGGALLLAYDAASQDRPNAYRIQKGVLDRIFGIDLRSYQRFGEKGFIHGPVTFTDRKATDLLEIPPGKLDEKLRLLGYKYGVLEYGYSHFSPESNTSAEIYARGVDGAVLLSYNRMGKGGAFASALPLGYLKSQGDELLLRSILRTLLFRILHLPHLVNAPNGRGTLVINWHIDSSVEYTTFPWLLDHGFIRSDINQSFHITAGPYRDYPGDGLGFDATGKGRPLIEQMQRLGGTIGSHGGWAHNWFSNNLQNGKFSPEEIEKYVRMNDRALEEITGKKIREYSAAAGGVGPGARGAVRGREGRRSCS